MFDLSKVLKDALTNNEIRTNLKPIINIFRNVTNSHVETKRRTCEKKILKVAIIGCPNAGKSTLINQIAQRNLFAVSKKVHTTRCRSRGILVDGDTQLVFLDTPGLVSFEESQKYNLNESFVSGGENAIGEADVIGVIHDVSIKQTRNYLDSKICRLLHIYKEKDSFLILNKIDTVKSKRSLLKLSDILTTGKLRRYSENVSKNEKLSEIQILEKIKEEPNWPHFSDVFMISALLGQGTHLLKNYLLSAAHPGEWIYSEKIFTDQKPVKRIEESVRSKLLEYLPNEVPYNLNVELEYLNMDDSENVVAVVLVGCKSGRLKKLVIGSRGNRIRIIASEAEHELSSFFFKPVQLHLVLTGPTEDGNTESE